MNPNVPRLFGSAVILGVLAPTLPATAEEVTFAEDIAPIVFNNCTICHRPGEIQQDLPWTNYEEISAFADMIAEVVSEGVMPPWPPDRSFSQFVGERTLSETQIKLIQDWAAAGAPLGDPDKVPPLPDFPEGSVLGEPDLTLTFDKPYRIKGNNRDEYRVFVLPTGLTEDKELVAVEFRPGNPQIVHHAILSIDTTGEGRTEDARSSAAGFPSFGGFGVPATEGLAYPGWVPGATPRFFPAGTGLKLPAGADLLIQIHYAPWPVEAEDQSSVNLFFAEKPIEREIQTRIILPFDIVDEDNEYLEFSPLVSAFAPPDMVASIARGVEDFVGGNINNTQIKTLLNNATLDTVFGNQLGGTVAGFVDFQLPAGKVEDFNAKWDITEDISLLNVWPHMHYLGDRWEITLERPDGSKQNLIRIEDWDFNWQGAYTFKKYIKAPAGSRILANARYDNSSANFANPNKPPKRVSWGEGTEDEMLFLPFSYVSYEEGDEDLSLEAFSPGDLPMFRLSDLSDDRIEFRLQRQGAPFVIQHSLDMLDWVPVEATEADPEASPAWRTLTVPRTEESAGFYRALITP